MSIFFFKEISFFFFEDDNDKPVYIITTLDNVEDDLLTLEYIKVRKEQTSLLNSKPVVKSTILLSNC